MNKSPMLKIKEAQLPDDINSSVSMNRLPDLG